MGTKMARQLWGRDFDIVKEGLDESQVAMFITELIGERDMLLQRQEHMLSLSKLAERTVAEADKLAEEIKTEAEKEARNKYRRVSGCVSGRCGAALLKLGDPVAKVGRNRRTLTGGSPLQAQCARRTDRGAHATPHAPQTIDHSNALLHRQRLKLAAL